MHRVLPRKRPQVGAEHLHSSSQAASVWTSLVLFRCIKAPGEEKQPRQAKAAESQTTPSGKGPIRIPHCNSWPRAQYQESHDVPESVVRTTT